MTVVQHVFKFLLSVYVVSFSLVISSGHVLANVSELLAQGDNYRLSLYRSVSKRAEELSYFKISS